MMPKQNNQTESSRSKKTGKRKTMGKTLLTKTFGTKSLTRRRRMAMVKGRREEKVGFQAEEQKRRRTD